MGKRLAESLPSVRRLYDRAAEVLGYDLAKLCFEGPADELDSTVYSQPAIFVTSLAALGIAAGRVARRGAGLRSHGRTEPGRIHGHGVCGGDGFRRRADARATRGAAMQDAADATPSGMVGILGLEQVEVEALCEKARNGEILKIANLLCPQNIVISGSLAACERAAEMAQSFGAMKAVPLAVAGAFHTEIMRPADQQCAEALADVPMHKPRIPVISNVDALPHDDPEKRSARFSFARSCSRCGGKTRCVTCCSRDSTSFTRLGRAACCAACCGGSIARHRAKAWKCEGSWRLGIRIAACGYRND